MFGTFVAERDDLPCNYGLVKPLRSNNPVVIAFREWAALGRDLWRSPTWRARLACLIGPPGDGEAVPTGSTPTPREDRSVRGLSMT